MFNYGSQTGLELLCELLKGGGQEEIPFSESLPIYRYSLRVIQ